jgi:hypothetical protein
MSSICGISMETGLLHMHSLITFCLEPPTHFCSVCDDVLGLFDCATIARVVRIAPRRMGPDHSTAITASRCRSPARTQDQDQIPETPNANSSLTIKFVVARQNLSICQCKKNSDMSCRPSGCSLHPQGAHWVPLDNNDGLHIYL